MYPKSLFFSLEDNSYREISSIPLSRGSVGKGRKRGERQPSLSTHCRSQLIQGSDPNFMYENRLREVRGWAQEVRGGLPDTKTHRLKLPVPSAYIKILPGLQDPLQLTHCFSYTLCHFLPPPCRRAKNSFSTITQRLSGFKDHP